MPVHLFGQSVQMDALAEIAAPRNIALVEDAAQAIGAEFSGRRVGSIGAIGCFSFYPTKNLGGAGDGGMLTTQSDELADKLEEELGDDVYSTGGESLEQIAGYFLQMRGATLAVAESCTGGLLSERITSVSGSSRYFLGGAITYHNELKTTFAGVPPLMIQAHGAVSREVATAMAEGIRHDCNATIGVAITGVAGPTGGTEERPVGLVYHALHDGHKTTVVEKKFMGDRTRIRRWAAQQALDMIRRHLR